jgi:hypothetical protein
VPAPPPCRPSRCTNVAVAPTLPLHQRCRCTGAAATPVPLPCLALPGPGEPPLGGEEPAIRRVPALPLLAVPGGCVLGRSKPPATRTVLLCCSGCHPDLVKGWVWRRSVAEIPVRPGPVPPVQPVSRETVMAQRSRHWNGGIGTSPSEPRHRNLGAGVLTWRSPGAMPGPVRPHPPTAAARPGRVGCQSIADGAG